MDIIGESKIWSYSARERAAKITRCVDVRRNPGHRVENYMELATKLADLQFRNREYVLLFRGQARDFRNQDGESTLKPSILRSKTGPQPPHLNTLSRRYDYLRRAERHLVEIYELENLPDPDRLKRQQILRWAILQHYEICDTPLLDVTHSLRIAASFASTNPSEAFLFVLGVPHISGAITASAEAGLQIVRLASVCPPSALRPHVQEGYLLGEYPDLAGVDQKAQFPHFEVDFGRRLIAKFRFDTAAFWFGSDHFPKIPRGALFPSESEDPLKELAIRLKRQLGSSPP